MRGGGGGTVCHFWESESEGNRHITRPGQSWASRVEGPLSQLATLLTLSGYSPSTLPSQPYKVWAPLGQVQDVAVGARAQHRLGDGAAAVRPSCEVQLDDVLSLQ